MASNDKSIRYSANPEISKPSYLLPTKATASKSQNILFMRSRGPVDQIWYYDHMRIYRNGISYYTDCVVTGI